MYKKALTTIRDYRYELIALLTGASVMILEIVGARLIAPYFGTSTYVWTSMIGIILGSLSLGFWYGGRLADKYDTEQDLGLIIAGAAALVLAMTFLQEPALELIINQQFDLRFSSAIAAIILFGPPSALIGMVSPHLAKLRVTSLKTTGTSIGRLEAAGAIGSIGGTFLSGYWLLAYLGARNVTLWLVVLLICTSFLANPKRLRWLRATVAFIAIIFLNFSTLPIGIIHDSDSAYSRYRVARASYNDRPAHLLLTDKQSIQSGMYLDDPDEPVFSYTQLMTRVVTNTEDAKRILIVGGGAHTMPTILAKRLPQSTFDVVEIDPALDDISRQYFNYKDMQNIHVHYEDGRTYINKSHDAYDLIIMDAFNSLTPPFHLTSREAVLRLKYNLSRGGLILINAPADFYGEFLPSLLKTYTSVFTEVSAYQSDKESLNKRQNFLIVATDDKPKLSQLTEGFPTPVDPPKTGLVLSDDYAPVERLSY